jgi:hypothetical protein
MSGQMMRVGFGHLLLTHAQLGEHCRENVRLLWGIASANPNGQQQSIDYKEFVTFMNQWGHQRSYSRKGRRNSAVPLASTESASPPETLPAPSTLPHSVVPAQSRQNLDSDLHGGIDVNMARRKLQRKHNAIKATYRTEMQQMHQQAIAEQDAQLMLASKMQCEAEQRTVREDLDMIMAAACGNHAREYRDTTVKLLSTFHCDDEAGVGRQTDDEDDEAASATQNGVQGTG